MIARWRFYQCASRRKPRTRRFAVVALLLAIACAPTRANDAPNETLERSESRDRHLLYVAGKASIRVFDIDHEHELVRKVKLPIGRKIRGIAASAITQRLYLSYGQSLACIDLATDEILWIRKYESGADRMAITPDGRTIYMPSGYWTDTPYWYVIDASSGDVVTRIDFYAAAHNTVAGIDGRRVYLASRRHNMLAVVDTADHRILREVGPFGDSIRPFTIDRAGRRVFATVSDLLGFEIGDLVTGEHLARVLVDDFEQGPVKHHHCPSHGIGLTPDESEIWVVDAFNQHLHVFDNGVFPPRQSGSIKLSSSPYWITFDIDGRYAYPSTGDVIDIATRRIVATLRKNNGKRLRSEKMLEIDFRDRVAIRVGDQFGVGRRRISSSSLDASQRE
jgi:DNA-binding beta-propeller fold protein YncE